MTKRKEGEPIQSDVKYLEDTLYVIGGKWKLHILLSLGKGNHRFKEIQRSIPGITSRILSKELKELELNQIIRRKVDANVCNKVDYEVLAYCKSFDPIIKLMIEWGKQHRKIISGKERISD